jgi:DNA-binding GntR family transcriptional regulator
MEHGRKMKPTTTRAGREPRSTNLAEAVYERIKSDIYEFRLLPGARFSENEIALRTGVSRTPVREALYQLQREGFLLVHAKSGWSVCPLDFDRFDHLYDVRVILELAAVRMLCASDFGDALSALKRVWTVGARARERDPRMVAELDEAFHAALLTATGNPELARLHADVTARIRIIRRLDFTQPARIHDTYEEHAVILGSILARKAQQAAMLLKAHIEASKLEVRKISLHRMHIAHRSAADLAPPLPITSPAIQRRAR